jgi:hypothetical protein
LQRGGFKNLAGYAREYAGKNILKITKLEIQKVDILSVSGNLNKVEESHTLQQSNGIQYLTT